MARRKRFSLPRFLLVLFCLVASLPLLWLAHQHIGPRSAGPAQDPIIALNAAGAAVNPNAADVYRDAFAWFREPDFERWKDETGRSDQPLPTELLTWLESQAETIELVRRAATIRECWFPLRRDDTGVIDLWTSAKLRLLVRLLAIRARAAVQERNIEHLAETVSLLNALARHAYQQATVIDQLVGIATSGAAVDYALVPYAWPEIDKADRVRYAEAIAPAFEPPPPLTRALQFDRDDYCWTAHLELANVPRVMMPPERIFGELDRRLSPYWELAALPLHDQISPDNPLLARLAAHESAAENSWVDLLLDPVGTVSRQLCPSYLRAFELRARLITIQRGSETVASLFRYRDDRGQFPVSLEVLGSASQVDPHTAAPFIYRVTRDGFTLYSAGLDRDDDGGAHHYRFGEQKEQAPGKARPEPDGDYVFWPLPE